MPISAPPGLPLPQDFPPLLPPLKDSGSADNTRSSIKPVNETVPALISVVPKPPDPLGHVNPVMQESFTNKPTSKNKNQRPSKNAETVKEALRNLDFDLKDSKIDPNPSIPDPRHSNVDQRHLGLDSTKPSLPKITSQDTSSNSIKRPKENSISKNIMVDGSRMEDKAVHAVDRRQRPGKLDIAAAKDASWKAVESMTSSAAQAKPETPSKTLGKVAHTTSQPSTPATGVSQSTASSTPRHTAPRTIRVVQTPKDETSRLTGAFSGGANSVVTPEAKQVSRQPSIVSINQPGTPVNEFISDNASLTSTSISRPGSPPTGKVGSAPLRHTTKSHQKKERQTRAKRAEESKASEETNVDSGPVEPVQAPIIGRKKKTKKITSQAPKEPDLAASTPSSPKHGETGSVVPKVISAAHSGEKSTRRDNKKAAVNEETKSGAVKETVNEAADSALEVGEKLSKVLLTASAIFADLQKAREVSLSAMDLFRNLPGRTFYPDSLDIKEAMLNHLPPLTDEQRELLAQDEAVCVETGHNKRVVVLPDRRLLHGFSAEEAQRYLELRKRTMAASGPTMFHSPAYPIENWLHVSSPLGHLDGHLPNQPYGRSGNVSQASGFMHGFAMGSMSQGFASSSCWAGMGAGDDTLDGAIPPRGPALSVEEAERAMIAAREEVQLSEKKLNALIKKNRKLLGGNGH